MGRSELTHQNISNSERSVITSGFLLIGQYLWAGRSESNTTVGTSGATHLLVACSEVHLK